MHDQTRGSVDQQLREVQPTAQHQLSLSPTTIDASHANSRVEIDAVAAVTAHLRPSAGTATHSGPTPLNKQPCHLATAMTDGILRPGSRSARPAATALSLPGLSRTSSMPPVQTQGLAAVLARVDNTMSHGTVHPRQQQQQQQQQHGAKPKLDAVLRRKSSKDRAPASTDGAVPGSPISAETPVLPGKCDALPPQCAQSAASYEGGRTSTKAAATGFKGPSNLQQQQQQPSWLQPVQPQQQQSLSQQQQQQQSGHACISLRLLPTETPLHSDCVRPDCVLQHCGPSIPEAKDAYGYREAQGVIDMMAALAGKLAAVLQHTVPACMAQTNLLVVACSACYDYIVRLDTHYTVAVAEVWAFCKCSSRSQEDCRQKEQTIKFMCIRALTNKSWVLIHLWNLQAKAARDQVQKGSIFQMLLMTSTLPNPALQKMTTAQVSCSQ